MKQIGKLALELYACMVEENFDRAMEICDEWLALCGHAEHSPFKFAFYPTKLRWDFEIGVECLFKNEKMEVRVDFGTGCQSMPKNDTDRELLRVAAGFMNSLDLAINMCARKMTSSLFFGNLDAELVDWSKRGDTIRNLMAIVL